MAIKLTKYIKINNEKALKKYLNKTEKNGSKESSRRNRASTNSK